MRGASAVSLAQAEQVLTGRFANPRSAGILAEELFAIVDALDQTPALLRVLANPNRAAGAKADLIARVLDGHDQDAVAFAQEVAALRWSHDHDLADALETLAIHAQLAVVEAEEGGLEGFEDAVFRFDRLCLLHREVRLALTDSDASPAAREKLFDAIVRGHATPAGFALLKRMTMASRGRSLTSALVLLGEISAARRGRLVATVSSGTPLSSAQRARLERILQNACGRDIHLNVSRDPRVVGGMRILLGDDVVDATVLARIGAAQRAVAH